MKTPNYGNGTTKDRAMQNIEHQPIYHGKIHGRFWPIVLILVILFPLTGILSSCEDMDTSNHIVLKAENSIQEDSLEVGNTMTIVCTSTIVKGETSKSPSFAWSIQGISNGGYSEGIRLYNTQQSSLEVHAIDTGTYRLVVRVMVYASIDPDTASAQTLLHFYDRRPFIVVTHLGGATGYSTPTYTYYAEGENIPYREYRLPKKLIGKKITIEVTSKVNNFTVTRYGELILHSRNNIINIPF